MPDKKKVNFDTLNAISADTYKEEKITEIIDFIDFEGFKNRRHLSNYQKVEELLEEMSQVFYNKSRYYQFRVNTLFNYILSEVVEQLVNHSHIINDGNNKIENILLYLQVCHFITI